MMDCSDRHARYLWRLISKRARLYTEMVVSGALIHGERERFLRYHDSEHPLALQVGGSNPSELAECAKMAEDWGYDEINLNCGCPSSRVQNGNIGAVLMAEATLVADCVAAMKAACSLPVTVKHRVGIDDQNEDETLPHFVGTVADAGCEVFIVHARKAWLQGLSPKENRDIPPLQYERVCDLKRQFPQLTIVINGGITRHDQSAQLLQKVDGVMVGREAYSNPYSLAAVDALFFESALDSPSRAEVMERYLAYAAEEQNKGVPLHLLTRHLLGLYHGQPGGKAFRRHISTLQAKGELSVDSVLHAAEYSARESDHMTRVSST